ncbi:PIG-L family deacetylase [Butyrivibrio sp. M55]|uniref:PIG-L family deacetylase n=1 Tax=Butyrivibrio sp. M55 TaxID=1855323 RepID=UPI0008EC2D75|nr:PIG-L family deacetylase [Butyrivibrio sp. M55]SFU54628.1 GlcNAc-PI de-N-acetylase [Butyrivibrio sp. M55]
MKNVVFFVPHMDDELFVGGGLLYSFGHSNEWQTYVVYATNGDFYPHEAEVRFKEAIRACNVLGVPRENIIFLGYGDGWRDEHIYNSNEVVSSMAGRSFTYAPDGFNEYCFIKHGKHNSYLKKNYVNDVAEVIIEINPEVLVCVDFDNHPDHRMLYLCFLEALKAVKIKQRNYNPLVLTKPAYENSMCGERDYYKNKYEVNQSGTNDLLCTPILKWNHRIAFKLDLELLTKFLTKNPIYKAACCHYSQCIRKTMDSAINMDISYWRLRVDNLALLADIYVSTGKKEYLTDFKTIDAHNVIKENCQLDASVWVPEKKDTERIVKLRWKKPVKIEQILVYENPRKDAHIEVVDIRIGNISKELSGYIMEDGSASILFDGYIVADKVEIKIQRSKGNAGLTEIAVYGKERTLDSYKLPISVRKDYLYEPNSSEDKQKFVLMDKMKYKVNNFFDYSFGNRYYLKRKYSNSQYKNVYLLRGIFWLDKLKELCSIMINYKKLNF